MFEPFDIFRITDGQPLWVNSASALETANSEIEKLGHSQPGEYLIFCHHSGDKISVSVGEGE
jgi:hypothetical protein